MFDAELTLEELSERTGVEARTLRSWVSEGLLAPPFKPGRGAKYPSTNADRALAVRALKEVHGLSLSEIGRLFIMATEEQIREWALEVRSTSAPGGTARDYLRRIGRRGEGEGGRPRSTNSLENQLLRAGFERISSDPRSRKVSGKSLHHRRSDARYEELANIERLIFQLEEVLETPAPRRSRGAIWTRISVTPDLEISVRGELEPSERVLFEQLADQFRAILTGRTKND